MWVFIFASGLSLVAESEGYSQAAVPSLVVEHGLYMLISMDLWTVGGAGRQK